MVVEKLVSERRSTVSYKDDYVFRKYYKYADEDDVLAEANYSKIAEKAGINCPRYLGYGYSENKKMFYSEYEYRRIQPIDRHSVGQDVVERALEITEFMPAENKKMYNTFKRILEYDVSSISEYLPYKNSRRLFEILASATEKDNEIIIHGDYTFENIGWDMDNNDLIVFDFQNACVGIRDWDKVYLISSLSNKVYYSYLKEEQYELARLISAIRYGRGIRKNLEIEERRRIYEYWW